MKILVTGGAGFIGSHLVKLLVKEGHHVIVLDNFLRGNKLDRDLLSDIQVIDGDVRDDICVHKAAEKCELIYHFAAILGVDIVADNPIETMDTEIIGMKNIVNAAILNGTEKVVYASTSGVYGKSALEKAVNEEIDVSPRSSYSIAKRYNEIYLASVYKEKRMQSMSLRFFNVYGEKQDDRMVIPRFFKQAMKNIPITVFGTGNQTRDFTYIDDVVKCVYEAARTVKGCEIFNISNNQEIRIEELARQIVNVCDSKSEISLISPPEGRYDFEVERRLGSSDKLQKHIGFSPTTTLDEGLKKVYQHLRDIDQQ